VYVSRELREFDLNEAKARFIAFVPKGANKKQYFLVKEDRQLKEDILKAILETDESEVSRTLKEAKLEGEAAGVLEATAKILKAYKDLLPEDALQILAKACGLPEPAREKGEPKPQAEKDAGKEAGLSGDGGAAGSGDPLNKEDLEKMDHKARSIIEKLLEEQQLTRAEADEAKRIAKELKDQQVLKEYVAKAEELQNLPVQPLKLGPVMKALGESHPREFEEIYKLLKAADAILDKSELFREFGKAGPGEGSAEAQIYAKARALVTKDAALTFEEAVEKVMDLEPELYEKAEEERQERIARRKGGR
jgi:hypothetical protein